MTEQRALHPWQNKQQQHCDQRGSRGNATLSPALCEQNQPQTASLHEADLALQEQPHLSAQDKSVLDAHYAQYGQSPYNAAQNAPRSEEQNNKSQGWSQVSANKSLPVFAAIDLGTNNCRLLIVRRNPAVHSFGVVPSARNHSHTRNAQSGRSPQSNGRNSSERNRHKPPFFVIDSYSKIVRLGSGLARNGRLSEEAMSRTIEALKVCAERLERRAVTHIRCVATQACRAAENCDEFLERIRAQTGLKLELIDGVTEAQLAYSSCAALLTPRIPYAVIFDIGGGSTELSWLKVKAGQKPQMLGTISVPWGVVTLCEGFDPEGQGFNPQLYAQAKERIAEPLRAFIKQHDINAYFAKQRVQVMGTSGTVTTLSALSQNLPRYERSKVDGSYLAYKQIRKISQELLDMSNEARSQLHNIGNSRSDLVVPGCAILEALCDLLPVERLRIADRGLREGLLYELMEQELRDKHNRRHQVYNT